MIDDALLSDWLRSDVARTMTTARLVLDAEAIRCRTSDNEPRDQSAVELAKKVIATFGEA